MASKKTIKHYYHRVLPKEEFTDVKRRISVINLFSFVGISITGLLAISALVNKNLLLFTILTTASFINFLGYYIQKKQGNFAISSSIIIFSLYLLMCYLVYSGGVENTGPLWIFMVAPVSLFLHGLKRGLFELLVFTCIIIIILYLPAELSLGNSYYPPEYKLRLIYSFLAVIFLSSVYEYSRQESYQELARLSHKYERLSKQDPLTKLSNRRDAIEKMTQEHSRIQRNNETFSLIICDIDHFKCINDKYGHSTGDMALIALSQLFSTHIRQQDTVARWGGEEFLFILPKTDLQQALIFSEKLHQIIRTLSLTDNGHSFGLSVSMGVCELNHELTINDAIIQADKYLYQAKKSGRNQTFPKPSSS